MFVWVINRWKNRYIYSYKRNKAIENIAEYFNRRKTILPSVCEKLVQQIIEGLGGYHLLLLESKLYHFFKGQLLFNKGVTQRLFHLLTQTTQRLAVSAISPLFVDRFERS